MRSMVEVGTRRGRNFRNVEASRTALAPSTTLLRKHSDARVAFLK
jgi:hypothetical protein